MNYPSSKAPAIEAFGLRKVYGDKVAVDALTLTVEHGEVFGFLGPNGAGKTTSIKILLGLVGATSGSGTLLGVPLGDHRVRARVGFMPEHFRFHDWLTAREFLALHADLYRMPRERSRSRIPELLDRVGLSAHGRKRLSGFSKGMLQRIGLAQALLNDPDLVFLDEPTSGLDPMGRRLVREIIRELRDTGVTVFLNSHLLGEVEVTCDRVAFVKQGAVKQISSLEALQAASVTVEVRARRIRPDVLEGLSRWSNHSRLDGEYLYFSVENEEALPEIHRYLAQQSVDIYSFKPQHVSLEDHFAEIIGTDGGL